MEDSMASSSTTTLTEVPVTLREVKMTDSAETIDTIEDDIQQETAPGDDDGAKGEATPKATPKPKRKSDMVKDENGFEYFRCRFCGLTYNYLSTLKAHERVHDVTTPYACNKCGETFHFLCELEYHAKTHLQQKGYKCDCGRTFYQYTDLLYHKHPEDEPDAFSIDVAVQEPTRSGVIQRAAVDPADFPTPDYAVKGFEPKHPLRLYSDIRSRPYICQYCSKSYPDSRQLAYHMSSHRGERIFNPRASRYLMCRNENSYISPGVYP